MKHITITAAIIAVVGTTQKVDADDNRVLVINKTGYFLMVTPTTGVPRFEKVDVVIDVSDGETVTPTDPTTPSADPIADAVEKIADKVGGKNDAATLAAVYQFFADQLKSGAMSGGGFRIGFTTARRIAAGRLANDWSDAFKKFDGMVDDHDDLAGALSSIADGLARSADESASAILESNVAHPESIEVAGILALIEAIIQLLELLGVLK